MFAANAQTFLRIGYPGMRSLFIAQEIVLELFHPAFVNSRVGSFFTTDGGRWNDRVSFRSEKIQEFLSYFGTGHHKRNNLGCYLVRTNYICTLCLNKSGAKVHQIKAVYGPAGRQLANCCSMRKIIDNQSAGTRWRPTGNPSRRTDYES